MIVDITVEIKESSLLEGHEIHYSTKCISVSPELFKLISVLENTNKKDKIKDLIKKSKEIDDFQFQLREANEFELRSRGTTLNVGAAPYVYPNNSVNLAKHGRRKQNSYKRRTKS
jgi:hypothetical protein